LGFEEEMIDVSYMQWNMCHQFEKKCVHVTLMDWNTCQSTIKPHRKKLHHWWHSMVGFLKDH
jgi:hypothetical protein